MDTVDSKDGQISARLIKVASADQGVTLNSLKSVDAEETVVSTINPPTNAQQYHQTIKQSQLVLQSGQLQANLKPETLQSSL